MYKRILVKNLYVNEKNVSCNKRGILRFYNDGIVRGGIMRKAAALVLAGMMTMMLAACGGGAAPATTAAPAGTNEAPAAADAGNAGGSGDAAGYPSGTVTVVVPFNAGSNTDTQMRFIQQHLEKTLGQSIVVENDGGASGTIGTTNFLQKEKDGYTVLFSLPTPTVFKPVTGETEYTTDDLIPAARVSMAAMYLVVKDGSAFDLPAQDLIAFIKDKPNEFTYANAGNGGIAQLALGVFLNGEGLEATSVPFTGGTADCYTAVMGDTVNAYVCGEQDLAGREGVHAVINLGTKSEAEGFKDVPTLEELGYKGYVTDNFSGFYFANGTDPAIVSAFSDAVQATLTSEEFVSAAKAANFAVQPGDAETFQKQVKDTVEAITPVMDAMGLITK